MKKIILVGLTSMLMCANAAEKEIVISELKSINASMTDCMPMLRECATEAGCSLEVAEEVRGCVQVAKERLTGIASGVAAQEKIEALIQKNPSSEKEIFFLLNDIAENSAIIEDLIQKFNIAE